MNQEQKIKSIQRTALFGLFIILSIGAIFIWTEFTKVSKIFAYREGVGSVDGGGVDYILPDYELGNTAAGSALFRENCVRCHLIERKMTGPALMHVKSRWADTADLYAWIKDSQKYINTTNDKYASDLFAEYNSIMPPFPHLTDSMIAEILYYVDP
jgi:cytochrome c551/c552